MELVKFQTEDFNTAYDMDITGLNETLLQPTADQAFQS